MKTVVLILVAIGVLTASLPAQAQDVKKSTAKLHFKTGTQYYNTANYEAALVEFEKAFKLFPIPDMLFNIARCHEALGQHEKAVQRYEEYLRKVPKAKNRGMLEERIRNIRRRIKAGKAAEPPPAPKPLPAPPPQLTTPPATDTPATETTPTPAPIATPTPEEEPADTTTGSKTWTIAGWTAIGVGGAALVTAAILGGLASSKTSDYEQAYADHKLYAESKGLLESAEGLELGCFVSLGVGVAAAAAGALILVLKSGGQASEQSDERSTDDDLASWRLRPTAGGFAFEF